MKFFRLLFAFLFAGATALYAQDTLRKYVAVRTDKAPKIDGILDDAEWQNVAVTENFIQSQPFQGTQPAQRTEVKVIYDDYAIYVAAMLYDTAPDSILREMGKRDDNNLNADYFRFVLDPYNKRQDAYDFGVWASGVQTDYKFSDPTFDAVWLSNVSINEHGWSVEMMIPFSAIRFPAEKEQKWAMQATRSIRRSREFDQWALTPQGAGNPLMYWGTLEGITDIKSPVRLSFTPYLSSYLMQEPIYNANGSHQYSNSVSYKVGADVKYGIDDRFTVDMTLLPDFGQVQSDNKVKNISFREVVYDENRPFFKESTELFNKGNLFYSRRIGKTPSGFYSVASQLNPGETIIRNPSQVKLLNATKLSGRTDNGLGIGVFNAVTDNAYAEIKDSIGDTRKILTEPLTNFNILVFDQQLKNSSSVYLINTNVIRDKGFSHANVTGSGFSLSGKKNRYSFDGAGILTQKFTRVATVNPTYTDQMGFHYNNVFRKISGNYQFSFAREVYNNTFDTRDLGYFRVTNYINYNTAQVYNIYTPNRYIRNSFNTLSVDYSIGYLTHQRTGFEINARSFTTLLNFISVFAGGGISPLSNYDFFEPRVQGRYSFSSEYYFVFAGFSSDYRKKLAIDMSLSRPNFFKNNFNNFPNWPGYNTEGMIRYRFSDKLSTTYRFAYSYDPYNPGFATFDNNDIIYGGRKLVTYTNTGIIKYIFSSTMALNLNARHYWSTGKYLDYFVLENNGTVTKTSVDYKRNFNYNAFNIDLVYQWIFSPGSMLSIVYKNAIETDTDVVLYNFSKNFSSTIESPQTNSLSLRFLYYLDYQFLKRKKDNLGIRDKS